VGVRLVAKCALVGKEDNMFIVIIALVVIVMVWFVLYNSLVQKKNQVTNVFATIDALLKKRYDLIPNLVAAVKNYME
jgi:LemA protein